MNSEDKKKNEFSDEEIKCIECGSIFIWFAKDKRFLAQCVENQTPNPVNGSIIKEVISPRRCSYCRTKRKAFFDNQKKQ